MVKFARCNALLSLALDANGKGCRFVAKGETDDEVVKSMTDHINSTHDVNGDDMKLNIMAATKVHA